MCDSCDSGGDWMRMFCIPVPMAMFGLLVSFMCGVTIGHVMSRKHAMNGGHYWGGGHSWKHAKMRHHHHGGGPACLCADVPTDQEQTNLADAPA